MDVDCEECAGDCRDRRALAPEDVDLDHEPRGGPAPLDDTYDLVSISSDEGRAVLAAGLGEAVEERRDAPATPGWE